jgi:hypothetical protein
MTMNRTLLKRISIQFMVWAGAAVLCSAILCSVAALAQDAGALAEPSQGQPAAQTQGPRTDGQIEMDVVHALDASQALKNDLITAATIQSEVTLSGTVSSEASKKLAGSIASHVDGVTKVHNNLTVGNPQDAQAMHPAPDNEAQEMPDNQQEGSGTAGLPPPGPAPDQYPNQGQYPPQGQYPAQAPYPPQQPYPPQGGAYPPPRPPYPNPQYGQYPPQYGQYPPQYAPAPPAQAYTPATGPVTLAPGTLLQLRTSESVDSKRAKEGEPVQFVVIQDVTMGGVLAIPRGVVVHGVVTESKNVGSGDLAGSSVLALTLTSLDLGGRNYPLLSDQFKVKGPNKAGQTVGSAIGGGVIGTIIGCAVGRGAGCAIGAGAGVAGGTAASAASPGPRVWIPAEALVTFHIKSPLTVDPVSPQEAARLAQGLYPGGPMLYRRAYYPYGAYYAYPPVYYRPYYVDGGYYYWR